MPAQEVAAGWRGEDRFGEPLSQRAAGILCQIGHWPATGLVPAAGLGERSVL